MGEYEYWVPTVPYGLTSAVEQTKFLNDAAVDGWELIIVHRITGNFYMRRIVEARDS